MTNGKTVLLKQNVFLDKKNPHSIEAPSIVPACFIANINLLRTDKVFDNVFITIFSNSALTLVWITCLNKSF